MIASNPYNLPDKILKQNTVTKPITLQNKKSRDKSYDFSKELASKGIKIDAHIKKSLNLQHITSSPNLHTPSTSSSTNRPLEPPTLPRQIEYLQTHIQPNPESEQERKIKFLFEKFYQMKQQINIHDSLLNKLVIEKDKDRNLYDSPFDLSGIGQKQNHEKEDIIRNQVKNLVVNGYASVSSGGNEANSALKEIDQLKKQVINLKQQISTVKNTFNWEKEHSNNAINLTKSIKFNSNLQHQFHALERKFTDDFSRVYQMAEQLKISIHDKIMKIQNLMQKIDGNNQIVGHKVTKAQEKIDSIQSSIQNHMNLVNQEINDSLNKIVDSINSKISKALENNVSVVNEKLKKCIERCKNIVNEDKKNLQLSKIEGKLAMNTGIFLKLSGYRGQEKSLKIKMKSVLAILEDKNRQKNSFYEANQKKSQYSPSKQSTEDEEIVLDSNIYHIDSDGFLMDENKIYLTDENNNLLQLGSDKMAKIKQLGLLF